jgi:uroporphyrinogen-III decarboxylase
MPKGGNYFDPVIRQGPFDEDNPPVEDNLEEYTIISDEVLAHYQKEAESLRKNTGYAIVLSPGGTALGDIASIPATHLKHPKGIRDMEEWYMCLASRQGFLKELYDRQTQIALKNFSLLKEAVGDNIDILFLCGADLGTQNGLMFSVETFCEVYLPYYKRMIGWIHANTGWKVLKHCCGSIRPLIPKFIEAGFDILNPVQNSARDMDPQTLKDEFGGRIAFWGGGVDTQHTLPFGSPDEVFREVTERIRVYGKGGGFVFNTIHNTQSGVPVENFLAMMDAVNRFR